LTKQYDITGESLKETVLFPDFLSPRPVSAESACRDLSKSSPEAGAYKRFLMDNIPTLPECYACLLLQILQRDVNELSRRFLYV
jgi:hypothetical protein